MGTQVFIGAAGLIAVIVPFGQMAWIASSAIGWGSVIAIAVASRLSEGTLADRLFVRSME
jgi:hypothetical protein